ncbi:MAG TPA: hypothetical protein VGP70_19440 [Actinomadura sp.]|nr:hypothetical protein [Actinomadura sp.]
MRRNAARGSGIPPGWTNLLWSAVAPGRPGECDRGRGDELALDHRARRYSAPIARIAEDEPGKIGPYVEAEAPQAEVDDPYRYC